MTTEKPPQKRRRARRKPVDPRAVLEQLAADPNAPAAVRYGAASRLLALDREIEARKTAGHAGNGDAGGPADAVTARALELMTKPRRLN